MNTYTVSVKIITAQKDHYFTAHSDESYDDCWRQIENVKKRIDRTAITHHISSTDKRAA